MAVTVIKNYTRRIAPTKKSKTGLIIGISLLALTGIGFALWYMHDKKKKALDAKNGETPVADQSSTGATTGGGPKGTGTIPPAYVPPTSGQTISSSTNPVIVEPAKPENTLDFQRWANKTKGTSLTEDGIFGPKTSAVWNTYGAEYTKIKSMKMQDFNAFMKSNGNAIGKEVYSKYGGADVFDGNTVDTVFTKVATMPKAQILGKVAKVIATPAGDHYWVTFSGAKGKFYKMYSDTLNIMG